MALLWGKSGPRMASIYLSASSLALPEKSGNAVAGRQMTATANLHVAPGLHPKEGHRSVERGRDIRGGARFQAHLNRHGIKFPPWVCGAMKITLFRIDGAL